MLERNNRLLIVDDNQSIHEDFRKVLNAAGPDADIAAAEEMLFGAAPRAIPDFKLTMASQGEEAVDLTQAAVAAGEPFAMVFLDIRMPPGIDGIETARRLWEVDPELQVVICSAYSDYSWSDMAAKLGPPERWVLLKKPFENIEVLQLAASLTQKRSLQQIAKARRADLEGLVAERTANLEQALAQLSREATQREQAEHERRGLERKLEQAQRLESLGVLAGGVAHDFNNILTGILGRTSLAQMQASPDSEVGEHLRAIELCARRAAELCEQMLAYAGQGRVAERELDINELVRESRGLVEASVPRDVELTMDFARQPPIVRGDPARLRQIVMNLVINGAEALGDGLRQLRLSTARCRLEAQDIQKLVFAGEAQPGDFVRIQVSDTGMGMSAETIHRIFEPFFTTKFEGRGLGLCAVHGIVRSHGGALDVESTPGQGSTFRVYLPLAASVAAAVVASTRTPATASGGRILVVDDEECVRVVLAETLRRAGYRVLTASDGLDALEQLRRAPDSVDGAVLDLTMPRMGGIEALEGMRQLRPGLPAVLISGHGQQRMVERISEREVTQTLQKPFAMEQLVAAVTGVLRSGDVTAVRT